MPATASILCVLTASLLVTCASVPSCDFNLTAGNPWETTIQAALDASSSDPVFVICVEPATYTGCGTGASMFTGGGGSVQVIGLSSGAVAMPTVDCEFTGRAVRMVNAGADLYMHNLRIVNGVEVGSGTDGGAVLLDQGSALTLSHVTIELCRDVAVRVDASQNAVVTLINSRMLNNSHDNGDGGALRVEDGNELSVVNSVFMYNSAEGGSAIRLSANAHINSSVFEDNLSRASSTYNGIIRSYASTSLHITNCTIAGNTGHGLNAAWLAVKYISDSTIVNNTLRGVFVNKGAAFITACEISGNQDGGIRSGVDMLITNCTIHGNTALYQGGGVDVSTSGSLVVTLTVRGGSISNNAVASTYAHGGAIYANGDDAVVLEDVVITGNSVQKRSVIAAEWLSMSGCTVAHNDGNPVWQETSGNVSNSLIECNRVFGSPFDTFATGFDFTNSTLFRNNYVLDPATHVFKVVLPENSINWQVEPNQDPRECPAAPKLCDLADHCVTNTSCVEPVEWEDADGCVPVGLECTCGNGGVDACGSRVEPCDDGNADNTDACSSECVAAYCGDGYVASAFGEKCDDGNSINNDDCSNSCTLNCGNGVVDANSTEACDDGNAVDGDDCSNNCTLNCGNGVVDANSTEACDDGNSVSGDGCETDCTPSCGNGVVDAGAGEECDDGNAVDNDDCSNNCTLNCGNGVVEGTEECDDGNGADGDACSNACALNCGNGVLDSMEECDDGNGIDTDDCANDCSLNCGNGLVDANSTEECDDGNTFNNDDCANDCTLTCGNGVRDTNSTEECDDGNSVAGDGCEPDCTLTYYSEFTSASPLTLYITGDTSEETTYTTAPRKDDSSGNNIGNRLAEDEAQQRRTVVVASSVSAAAVSAFGLVGLLLYLVRRRGKVGDGGDDVVILEGGVELDSEESERGGRGSEKAVGSSSE